eukprot:655330-Rhodomonas_salina.1
MESFFRVKALNWPALAERRSPTLLCPPYPLPRILLCPLLYHPIHILCPVPYPPMPHFLSSCAYPIPSL